MTQTLQALLNSKICRLEGLERAPTAPDVAYADSCRAEKKKGREKRVGFPLTFSKTCTKCPFHYWLNNVIWAPTGPNRSRQRQSCTHMLRINQIMEGVWGRERVRGRMKEGETELDT